MADYAVSSSSGAVVTLLEAKRHLNVSTTEDDQFLTSTIEAATRYVENLTGRCYAHQQRRMTMNSFQDGRYVIGRRLYPQRSPITGSSDVSITYVDTQGTTQTLPSSDYQVNANEHPSNISEAYNATWPNTYEQDNSVTVTYSVKTSTTPATVKHAINMLVGHWYNHREATADRPAQEIALGVNALLGPEMVERYG